MINKSLYVGSIIIALFVHAKLALLLIIFGAGVALGFAISVPDYTDTLQKRLDLWRQYTLTETNDNNKTSEMVRIGLDGVPTGVGKKISIILDLFWRDFISFWYQPLNKSQSQEFELCLRSSLNATIMNAMKHFQTAFSSRKTVETSTVIMFSFANSLIVHLREYRMLESHNFENDVNFSVFYTNDLVNRSGQLKRMRSIAATVVKKILYQPDQTSPCVQAIVTELVATSVLDPIIQKLADPYFINSLLIDLLKNVTEANLRINEDFEVEQDDLVDQKHLSVISIIRSDEFNDFASFLESQNAPSYLRFWTNVDFFKQFTCYQPGLDEATLKQTIQQDARAVFDMHFIPQSEFYLPLETVEQQQMIQVLKDRIEKDPGSDCFDNVLDAVLFILEQKYLPEYLSLKKNRDIESCLKSPGTTETRSMLSDDELNAYKTDEYEEEEEEEELGEKETPKVLRHLIIALSNLREQHMHICSTMEAYKQSPLKYITSPNIPKNIENYTRLNKLVKSKKALELEIERISAMIAEIEENAIEIETTGLALETKTIDLSDLDVKVSDATNDPSSPFFNKSMQDSTASSIFTQNMTRLKQTVFMVEVEKRQGQNGWIFYRTYSDFQQLDEELKEHFAKVSKILLPQPKKSSLLSLSISYDDRIDALCNDLQQYLRMLLVDQLLIESRPMQKFFRPQDIVSNTPSTSKTILAPELRKKISALLKGISTKTKRKVKLANDQEFVQEKIEAVKDESSAASTENKQDVSGDNNVLMDVDLFIDTCFAVLTEAFDLHTPTQWVRRKALAAIRQLILQQSKTGYVYSYLSTNIRETIDGLVRELFNEQTIDLWLTSLLDRFWPAPERLWYSQRKDYKAPNPSIITDNRYDEAKTLLRKFVSGAWSSKAVEPHQQHQNTSQISVYSNKSRKELLSQDSSSRPHSALSQGVPSSVELDATMQVLINLYRIAGKQNVVGGTMRILKMLQHPEFNRILLLNIIDVLVKCILGDGKD